jgi:CheY-like chemotaxis protein
MRILFAEDDAGLRNMLAAQLERKGYIVTAVEDGELLLSELVESEFGDDNYDLVITDNTMPMVTGIEALKLIRSGMMTKVSNVPVIVCSSESLTGLPEQVNDLRGIFVDKAAGFPALLAQVTALAA